MVKIIFLFTMVPFNFCLYIFDFLSPKLMERFLDRIEEDMKLESSNSRYKRRYLPYLYFIYTIYLHFSNL